MHLCLFPSRPLYALNHRTLQQFWYNSNSFLRNKERRRITLLLVSHLAKSFTLQFCALLPHLLLLLRALTMWFSFFLSFFFLSHLHRDMYIMWLLMKFWLLWKEMDQNTSPDTTDHEPQFLLCLLSLCPHMWVNVCNPYICKASQLVKLHLWTLLSWQTMEKA